MEMNCYGGSGKRKKCASGSSGKRKKGCSRSGERKKGRSGSGERKKGCSGSAFNVWEDRKRVIESDFDWPYQPNFIDEVQEGGVLVIYDQNSDPSGPKRDYHLSLARLAFLQQNHQEKGYTYFIEFLAKLPNQENDDAITFRASLKEIFDGSVAQVYSIATCK